MLALDVSASVDAREYDLQMQGLATALEDADLRAALLAGPETPVLLAVFEWSGPGRQRLISDWTALRSPDDLDRVQAALRAQKHRGENGSTALGEALLYAAKLLQLAPSCWRRTVDVSGDGKNNAGIEPAAARAQAMFDGVTINGLVIGKAFENTDEIAGNLIAELTAYYHQSVLHGPQSFLETALGFEDFARAMKQKILRETAVAVSLN